jgi:hypothetical protein
VSIYAAKVEGGTVTQVIVGDATWAVERLGGVWLPSDTLVGIGWQVVDGEIVPPPAAEPEFTGDLL